MNPIEQEPEEERDDPPLAGEPTHWSGLHREDFEPDDLNDTNDWEFEP